MAGTDDDHNPSDQSLEWLLITTAIALVARYMPKGEAKEFLLIELSAKHIHWRYHGKAEFNGLPFPLDDYFFMRHKLVEHEIATDGAVIRTGPALVEARSWPLKKGWKRYKPDKGSTYIFD